MDIINYALSKKIKKYVDDISSSNQVQSDWNQNDSTAADYVKGRTHYEESTYVDYVLNMSNTEITGFSIAEVGETMTVKINGVESAETVKETESSILGTSYKYIGNIDFDSLISGGTGWCVAKVQEHTAGFANPDTAITVKSIVVHKLDNKFIDIDGFIRTFEYHFKNCTFLKILYDDDGTPCYLYTCDNFVSPKSDSQLFGFMSEVGFSQIGSCGLNACFLTGVIIDRVGGNINIQNSIFGTNTNEMEELAANYGYTHITNPKA